MAKKYKEKREVLHCIEAHHNDVEPETVEALLVQAADAISAKCATSIECFKTFCP